MVARFRQLGHWVAGCGRTTLSGDVLEEIGLTAEQYTTLDVCDINDVQCWAEHLLETSEPPDILINNAGIINSRKPLIELSAKESREVIEVNVIGTLNLLHAFLPAMSARGKGIIVNMSSGWGRTVADGVTPYCASKWAIEGLSQALALEVPAGMAVVALNPGVIETGMLHSCLPERAPLCPRPEVWALRAVDLLLGVGASQNGHSLDVDGVI
jgi:NAD(P)-dependent dehydrogenase (short-subunit alcohol dehydrogenase family)